MAVATIKASSTTWVSQVTGSGYPTAGALRVTEAAGAAARGYIYCAPSTPPNATVSAATLTVFLVGPASGWGTLSLTRVTSRVPDSVKVWANQPSLGAVGAGAANTVAPAGTPPDATPVVFDVTAQVAAWATGTLPNFGWQLRNSGATQLMVYSAQSAHPPVLSVTYSTPPDAPHNLMPAGVISLAKPVLQFGPYGDPDGDLLQAVQVQVAATSTGFGAPTWDSGTVASVTPELDLTATAFGGFSGTKFWRARVQDSSGTWSDWSDPASVTVTAKPTPAWSTPSVATPHVFEATPQLVATCAGMTSWRIDVLDAATNAVLATSGHVSGATAQFGVPDGLLQVGGSYTAAFYAWDALDRSPTPGDPTYVTVSQAFDFTPGATTAPTAVAVTPGTDWPGQAVVTWQKATAPDYFTVWMDGQPIQTQITPGESFVSGTTYRAVVDKVPSGPHTFQVDAVTAHVSTAQSAVVAYTSRTNGIWVGDPVRKIWAQIRSGSDTSVDSVAMSDLVSVTSPIDGTIPQQIIRGMNGLAGKISGTLSNKADGSPSVAVNAANLMALKGAPQSTLRLVIGDINIPVKVRNVSVGPSSSWSTGNPWRTVSFDFFQCGEFAFKASL